MNYFLVWGITLTLVLLIAKLVVDFNQWCDQKHINHKLEWIILAILSAAPIYFFTKISVIYWWLAAMLSGLMIAFFIWIFFDGIFNKLCGHSWWFTGSDDPDDAKTDNFLQRLKLWQHVAIKIGGLAIMIILYILTIKS
jgi:hypothetical protein